MFYLLSGGAQDLNLTPTPKLTLPGTQNKQWHWTVFIGLNEIEFPDLANKNILNICLYN